jgi:hypothetical protein
MFVVTCNNPPSLPMLSIEESKQVSSKHIDDLAMCTTFKLQVCYIFSIAMHIAQLLKGNWDLEVDN